MCLRHRLTWKNSGHPNTLIGADDSGQPLARLAAALATISAKADELYGRIRCSINDPSGRAVPGVHVSATNDATGAMRQFVSGPDGSYELINLQVGSLQA